MRRPARPGAFSLPSINSGLFEEKKNEESEAGTSIIRENQDIDPQQLIQVWNDFVETIDNKYQKTALSLREPELKSETLIEFQVDNALIRDAIVLDVKHKLIGFLNRRLHNELIDVQFVISENQNVQSDIPYTDEEKFRALAEKNPLLIQLRKNFELDFE